MVKNDHGIAELQSKDNMQDIDSTSTHHARNSIEANKYVSQLLSAMAELPANPVTEKVTVLALETNLLRDLSE